MIHSLLTVILLMNSAMAEDISVTLQEVTEFNRHAFSMVAHPNNPHFLIITDCFAVWEFNPNTKEKKLIAGSNTYGYVEGIGENAQFGPLFGSEHFNKTTIIVTEYFNHCLRLVNTESHLTERYAGVCGSNGSKDGDKLIAQFFYPKGITRITDDFYVCDEWNKKIRKISQNTVSTLLALSYQPLALTSINNVLIYTFCYGFGEYNLSSQTNTILSGSGLIANPADGHFSVATFGVLDGVATISENRLVIADSHSHDEVKLVDLKKKIVSKVNMWGISAPESLIMYDGYILIGVDSGRIVKFKVAELPGFGNMEARVKLEAEYEVECDSLNEIVMDTIEENMKNHTFHLNTHCPDCHVAGEPDVKCSNGMLTAVWNTTLTAQQQVMEKETLRANLENELLELQIHHPIMGIPVISPSVKIVSPVKTKTGLFLKVVFQNSCVDTGGVYNDKYDVCESS